MLLIFAYNCNLRANLLFKPTETPVETYQVESSIPGKKKIGKLIQLVVSIALFALFAFYFVSFSGVNMLVYGLPFWVRPFLER